MLPYWVLSSPLPGLLAWGIVYCLDYIQTLRGARLYRAIGHTVLEFEGSYELTPQFQEDIDQLRTVSRRFILALILSEGLLLLFWALSVKVVGWWLAYELLLGAMLLMEAAIHLRHVRNIQLFRYLQRHPSAIEGHVRYRRALILWNSVWDLAGMGLLLAVLAVLLGSWFLGGGGLAVLALAARHWLMQRKARKELMTTGEAVQSAKEA